jgi:chromosome partitioning protein
MSRIYAITNQKGGVGKTTTAVNLAACLAEAGERSLVIANLDLVPSKPDLAGAVVELARREDGEGYLAQALASGVEEYDFVFLDCPPSLGPLTVNALAASNRVLVPVQAEYYALEGLTQLMHSIELIRRRLNPTLGIGGVLLTMVDGRTRLAAQVEDEVRRHFGNLVFRSTVPRSVRLAEAPSHGLPAIAYDRRSAGADAYWKVAMELVERA